MLQEIAEFKVFGIEVAILSGILMFLALLVTALLGLITRGPAYKPRRRWHVRVAYIAIALAVIHAVIVLLGEH